MLAAKILASVGVDVTLVCFESYFFSSAAAKKAADAIGLPLRVVDISSEQLKIVEHPRYGYGGAINPCIDCHLLMIKTAKKIMEAEGFDFVATGEVLGERPMSQNKQSLDIIERESGLAGKLLRPLSAQLLPPTEAEIKGLVDRSKLCGISGRSRQTQLELARKFAVNEIPQPGGGCILTEKEYGQRMKKLLEICPDAAGSDVLVLQNCRPIWEGRLFIAVARNAADCARLVKLAKRGDILFEPQNFPGPAVLVRDFGENLKKEEIESMGKKYLLKYSKKTPANPEISATAIMC